MLFWASIDCMPYQQSSIIIIISIPKTTGCRYQAVINCQTEPCGRNTKFSKVIMVVNSYVSTWNFRRIRSIKVSETWHWTASFSIADLLKQKLLITLASFLLLFRKDKNLSQFCNIYNLYIKQFVKNQHNVLVSLCPEISANIHQ